MHISCDRASSAVRPRCIVNPCCQQMVNTEHDAPYGACLYGMSSSWHVCEAPSLLHRSAPHVQKQQPSSELVQTTKCRCLIVDVVSVLWRHVTAKTLCLTSRQAVERHAAEA